MRDPGGLAGELDKLIEKWTYNGMPKKAQVTRLTTHGSPSVVYTHTPSHPRGWEGGVRLHATEIRFRFSLFEYSLALVCDIL